MYPILFSPLTIRGVTLKNRIVSAPTTLGLPPAESLDFLERIAAGGAAVITVGDVPAAAEPFSFGSPSPLTEEGFAFYRQLAGRLHRHQALACAQLHMSDTDPQAMRQLMPAVKAGTLTMDEARKQIQSQVGSFISHMPGEQIRHITESFGLSASRLREAGFDMIQLHGDRMCGSFLSSLFNRRTDCYGGSLENRSRFLTEAAASIRSACPDLPLELKLPVRMEEPHYGNAGVTEQELEAFLPIAEQAGIDCFHVTLADHSDLNDTIPSATHPFFSSEGCFLSFCDQVKKRSALPVCAVGGLTRPDFIEAGLSEGRMDYIAMSRQLIADPMWPEKVRSGRTSDIFYCIRCNQKCLNGLKARQGVHCIYDDRREQESPALQNPSEIHKEESL